MLKVVNVFILMIISRLSFAQDLTIEMTSNDSKTVAINFTVNSWAKSLVYGGACVGFGSSWGTGMCQLTRSYNIGNEIYAVIGSGKLELGADNSDPLFKDTFSSYDMTFNDSGITSCNNGVSKGPEYSYCRGGETIAIYRRYMYPSSNGINFTPGKDFGILGDYYPRIHVNNINLVTNHAKPGAYNISISGAYISYNSYWYTLNNTNQLNIKLVIKENTCTLGVGQQQTLTLKTVTTGSLTPSEPIDIIPRCNNYHNEKFWNFSYENINQDESIAKLIVALNGDEIKQHTKYSFSNDETGLNNFQNGRLTVKAQTIKPGKYTFPLKFTLSYD